MIDIKSSSPSLKSSRLSNFTPRKFSFEGMQCAGLESIIQALKCSNIETQKEICVLSGREAKRWGESQDFWKETQVLWWYNRSYGRSTREYLILISRIYDVAYNQDKSFKMDLLATGHDSICHSIGNPDMRDTVLTEVEMIYQLNRLRIRAFGESQ